MSCRDLSAARFFAPLPQRHRSASSIMVLLDRVHLGQQLPRMKRIGRYGHSCSQVSGSYFPLVLVELCLSIHNKKSHKNRNLTHHLQGPALARFQGFVTVFLPVPQAGELYYIFPAARQEKKCGMKIREKINRTSLTKLTPALVDKTLFV